MYNAENYLSEWARVIRRSGHTIVATNGCFDILHVGHLNMLEDAARLADFLVVGINSDSGVKSLKGPSRPINNEHDRKKMLEALRCVYRVHIFEGAKATRFLDAVKPDFYVKAGDYSIETLDPEELEVLKNHKTKIHFAGFKQGHSSSRIIRIIEQI